MDNSPQPREQVSQSGLTYLSTGSSTSSKGVLLCHGWSCQASDFTLILQALAQHNPELHYIAPYLPGHGPTPTSLSPDPSIPAFAQLLVDLITELKYTEIVLLGHSMGCRMILCTWSLDSVQIPGIVKALVLLDGSHAKLRSANRFAALDAKGVAGAVDIFNEMFSPWTPEMFRRSTKEHVQSRDQDYVTRLRKGYLVWDAENENEVVEKIGMEGVRVLQIQSTDVDATNRRRRLGREEDTGYMKFVRERVPTVKQVVVEDAGHFPHVDQWEAVSRCLENFVDGVYNTP